MCYRVDDCVRQDTRLQSRQDDDLHAMAASEVSFSYTCAQKEMISRLSRYADPGGRLLSAPSNLALGETLGSTSVLASSFAKSPRAVAFPYRNQLQNVHCGALPGQKHGGLGKGL